MAATLHPISPLFPCCFVHLQKTAGTSLIDGLSIALGERTVLRDVTIDEIPTNSPSLSLYAGHFDGRVTSILPPSTRYITIIREPIERIISAYYHDQRMNRFIGTPYSGLTGVPLEDAVHLPDFCALYKNVQTHILATFGRVAPNLHHHRHAICNSVTDHDHDQLTLLSAISALNWFVCVGTTELLPGFAELLAAAFGINSLPTLPRSNVAPEETPTPQTLSEDTYKQLVKLTTLDTSLYYYATRRFAQDFQKYAAPILNEKRSRTRVRKSGDKGIISMKELPISLGWQPEEDMNEVSPARWIGPTTNSRILFRLSNLVDWTLSFSIVGAMSEEILQSLTLQLNGTTLPLPDRITMERVSITVPGERFLDHDETNELKFNVSHTVQPKVGNRVGSEDVRHLGLLISEITFYPRNITKSA